MLALVDDGQRGRLGQPLDADVALMAAARPRGSGRAARSAGCRRRTAPRPRSGSTSSGHAVDDLVRRERPVARGLGRGVGGAVARRLADRVGDHRHRLGLAQAQPAAPAACGRARRRGRAAGGPARGGGGASGAQILRAGRRRAIARPSARRDRASAPGAGRARSDPRPALARRPRRRLPGVATLERTPQGQLEAVVLAAGELEATFVPAAGMIGCSLRHRGEELLVQRGGLGAWRGTGKSFGLPLLHPWANRLRDWRYAAGGPGGGDRPLARGRPRRRARPPDPRRARRRGGLGRRRRRARATPRPGSSPRSTTGGATTGSPSSRSRTRLTLELELTDDALTVTTTVEATGEDEVPLAFGWHPWLSLPGVPRAEWELAMPACEGLPLDDARPADGRADAGARPTPRRSATGCSTTTSRSPRTRASRSPAAAARSRWSGRAATRHAQVFAPSALDVVCLEPMMAPVAALSTGKGLRVAAPGRARERASSGCGWHERRHDARRPRRRARDVRRAAHARRRRRLLRRVLLLAVRGGLPAHLDGPRGHLPLRRDAPAGARGGRLRHRPRAVPRART